jgi:hypothetical protein
MIELERDPSLYPEGNLIEVYRVQFSFKTIFSDRMFFIVAKAAWYT